MIFAATSRFFRRTSAIGLAVLCLASASGAQAADEVRVDYESWQLYCPASKPGESQHCEIHQLLSNSKSKMAAGMYLTRRGDAAVLIVRVPLGVLLNKNMMLQIDNGIGTDALTFLRCDANGCLAQMPMTEPFLNSLRKSSGVTLTIYADASTPIPVKFTLKGFSAAEKALAARP